MAGRSSDAALGGPAGLRVLEQELASGWAPGLTVLTGGDLYHLDAAQRALLRSLVPDEESEMALTLFGEQRVDLSTVVNAARSMGMFSSRRVVLVRELSALEGDPAVLADYAAGPPASSYLMIRAPVLDRRRKLHQTLLKAGRVLKFEAVDPQRAGNLAGDVAALAKDKGLSIDRPAARLLAELCAGDFYRVDSELEKIRAWIGAAGNAVNVEVVREVAAGSGLLSGWELASALVLRDRAAALGAVRRLLGAGDEPLRMLGGLAFKVRGMIQAKAMIARGVAPAQAIRSARLFGDSPTRMAQGLQGFELSELLRFPSYLLDVDRTLKSRAVPPQALLEQMIDRMIPARPEGRRPR